MKHIWILRTAIIVLVSTNLFLLFELFGKPKHPPRLSHIVHAEGKQAQQLDNEMRRHHSAVSKWTQRQFQLRQKLGRTKPQNKIIRNSLLDQIATCQRNIDSITLAHFDHVTELCNSAQEKLFERFRTQILNPDLKR
jgi:hypothetical protein